MCSMQGDNDRFLRDQQHAKYAKLRKLVGYEEDKAVSLGVIFVAYWPITDILSTN